jgi:hypothetical protein
MYQHCNIPGVLAQFLHVSLVSTFYISQLVCLPTLNANTSVLLNQFKSADRMSRYDCIVGTTADQITHKLVQLFDVWVGI